MSIYRSELMNYFQLVLPRENAWDTLIELGQINCIQFIDEDPTTAAFARPFAPQIKTCDDLLQKLNFIESEMKKFQKEPIEFTKVERFLPALKTYLLNRKMQDQSFFEEEQVKIEENYDILKDQIQVFDDLRTKYNHFSDYKNVIEASKDVMFHGKSGAIDPEKTMTTGGFLTFIVGTVPIENKLKFERTIFRVTKGNVFQRSSDIKKQGNEFEVDEKKSWFVVGFQQGDRETIKNKIIKVCEAFNAQRFDLPEHMSDFKDRLTELDDEQYQTKQTLELTKKNIEQKLVQFQSKKLQNLECSYITFAQLYVQKEQCVYEVMNLLKLNQNIYMGHCWVPESKKDDVKHALQDVKQRDPNSEHAELQEISLPGSAPPTYFDLNAFTAIFQLIVNTYGIPRYQEVNPGLFTIIMFPFLFGVMFGDVFHGGFLFMFGIWMVRDYQKLKDTKHPLEVLFPARFLFILMGFFAFFAGFIYNDFASIPLNIFGSCFRRIDEHSKETELIEGCVYPLGMDPRWFGTENELGFFNSLKMKLAVIIGVLQMSFGICLKGANALHFKEPLDFIFEFVPQIIFLSVTFGYMCIMIVAKWLTNWQEIGTDLAPSIIGQLINIPLAGGSTGGKPLFDVEAQEAWQALSVKIALICVPLMLLPKPLILLYQNNQKKNNTNNLQERLIEHQPTSGGHGHGEFEFGEIFVHQMIETIEFVLGSISNTASYLRLWALSLAHGQLAKVFFEKCLGGGIQSGNFFVVFIGWPIFIHVTFAVLMCMDNMECFLHALRLQWVEFQNKFFKADGYLFQPFSFKETLQARLDEKQH